MTCDFQITHLSFLITKYSLWYFVKPQHAWALLKCTLYVGCISIWRDLLFSADVFFLCTSEKKASSALLEDLFCAVLIIPVRGELSPSTRLASSRSFHDSLSLLVSTRLSECGRSQTKWSELYEHLWLFKERSSCDPRFGPAVGFWLTWPSLSSCDPRFGLAFGFCLTWSSLAMHY